MAARRLCLAGVVAVIRREIVHFVYACYQLVVVNEEAKEKPRRLCV